MLNSQVNQAGAAEPASPARPGQPPRRGEWALLLGSLAVCAGLLAGAELAARWFFEPEAGNDLRGLHDYSAVYGWTPRPLARARDEGGWISINSRGYRGRLVSNSPTPQQRRVLMLGDSITFGLNVDDSETFSALLDRADNGLEVVNLAVQGYGLDQDLLKLEREGLAFSPEIVVLNVCVDNDLADTALPSFLYDERQPKPYFTNEGGRLTLHDEHLKRSWGARVATELRTRSSLFARLTARSPASGPDADERHWTDRKASALRDVQAVQELCFRLMARMSAAVAARGATLIVVLHPDKASFRRGSTWIEAFSTSPLLAGVPVVDLRQHYLARELLWRNIATDSIGHLSRQGHGAAAAILGELLLAAPSSQRQTAGPPELAPSI